MPNNPNAQAITVNVDGPTYSILGSFNEALGKLLSGEKPQQIAQEEIGNILAGLNQAPQIATDAVLDRASVERAFLLRLGDIIDTVLAARLAKAASVPK